MNKPIAEIELSADATISEAIRAMERPQHKEQRPAGIVVVVDSNRKVVGVVTDGDVRRAFLSSVGLDEPIERIMTRDPIVIRQDQVEGQAYSEVLQYIRRSRRMMDPAHGKIIVVDTQERVVDVVSLFDLLKLQSARVRTTCVVGMGYVGLTVAVALAEVGLTVYGVERNDQVRERLKAGDLHFYEDGLEGAYRSHLGKRLLIAMDPGETPSDIYLICVETPIDERGQPLLQDLVAASKSVAALLKRGDLVVIRSTVPIGTSRGTVLPILERESELVGGRDFDFVFAPERTVAGNALTELLSLPQVIGSLNRAGLESASALFRELTSSVITVDSLEEAEAVKLLNNAFRDHVFSFSNEFALICDKLRLDASRVIQAANEGYPRNSIPQPSPGVGGICLRKDPYLLLASARRAHYEPQIIGQSRRINEYMPRYVYGKIMDFLKSNAKNPRDSKVLLVGFAFKGEPETSDMRDSTTLTLVELLRSKVGVLLGYDPVIPAEDLDQIPGVRGCLVEEGFRETDCAVIMNNHRSYLRWNVYDLAKVMKRPALFVDGWRLFEAADISRNDGVSYWGPGAEYMTSGPDPDTKQG